MAQKIQAAFDTGCAFIPYITGGFPNMADCAELIKTMDANGADIIEVGIPFSDPLADGPVIQAASQQALEAGASTAGILNMVRDIAPELAAPVVIMTYYNPVEAMGLTEFAQKAVASGVAGVLIPDLPPEEADPWKDAADEAGLDTIFMAAPTTTAERLEVIKGYGRGFLYYVSMTGVTGSALELTDAAKSGLEMVRENSGLPVAVGFGVATPEQAKSLAGRAEGVIIGSEIIKQITGLELKQAKEKLAGFCNSIKAAIS